jgi:nucleotide-binding universal stress UspA family protein
MTSFDEAADRFYRSIPKEAYSQCRVKRILYEGEPYRRVLNYSEDQSIDLICMDANGTGFGAHALFGSNSDREAAQARDGISEFCSSLKFDPTFGE